MIPKPQDEDVCVVCGEPAKSNHTCEQCTEDLAQSRAEILLDEVQGKGV